MRDTYSFSVTVCLSATRASSWTRSQSSQNVSTNELGQLALCKPTVWIRKEPKSDFHTFNRTLHTRDILSHFSFQKAVVTAHLLPLTVALSIYIKTVKSLLFRVINRRWRERKLPSKRHLSSFVRGEPLCSAVQDSLTQKAASWLSIDESISKGQQV